MFLTEQFRADSTSAIVVKDIISNSFIVWELMWSAIQNCLIQIGMLDESYSNANHETHIASDFAYDQLIELAKDSAIPTAFVSTRTRAGSCPS